MSLDSKLLSSDLKKRIKILLLKLRYSLDISDVFLMSSGFSFTGIGVTIVRPELDP